MKKHPQSDENFGSDDKGKKDQDRRTGNPNPQASANPAPQANPSAGSNPADQQKLMGALESLREVLVSREVTALRGSLGDTKSDLSRRLDDAVKKSTDSIDKVMKDLSGKIDALNPRFTAMEDNQKKKLHEAKETTDRSLADMKKEMQQAKDDSARAAAEMKKSMQEAQEKLDAQLDSMKQAFDKLFAEKEAAMQSDINRLGQGLATLQNSLREQAANSQRLSGLLQNMGQLFAGGAAAAPAPSEPEDDGSLDNALDQMFQEVEANAPQPDRAAE